MSKHPYHERKTRDAQRALVDCQRERDDARQAVVNLQQAVVLAQGERDEARIAVQALLVQVAAAPVGEIGAVGPDARRNQRADPSGPVPLYGARRDAPVQALVGAGLGSIAQGLTPAYGDLLLERDRLRALLLEFVHCGVSFDDSRISYMEMQVDRRLLADAKAALEGGNGG